MLECLVRKETNEILFINGSIYGFQYRNQPDTVDHIMIPDQDISHLYYEHPIMKRWLIVDGTRYPDDVVVFTPEESAELIDKDGKEISEVEKLRERIVSLEKTISG